MVGRPQPPKLCPRLWNQPFRWRGSTSNSPFPFSQISLTPKEQLTKNIWVSIPPRGCLQSLWERSNLTLEKGRVGPCVPESPRMESSTHASSHADLLTAPWTLQTHSHLCVCCCLCLEYSCPRPLHDPCLHLLQVASAQRFPLITLPKSATPIPVTLQPLIPFYFPSKSLSPHGSIITVVLAKQDIYRGLGDKSWRKRKVTVQNFFPNCHLKTVNTQKGINMENTLDARLMKM